MNSHKTIAIIGLLFSFVVLAVVDGVGQEPGKVAANPVNVSVSVFTSRPLSAAAEQLEHSFGVGVSYEDIEWISDKDVIRLGDAPVSTRARQDLLVPSWGSAEVRFPVDGATRLPKDPPMNILQDLLSDHSSKGGHGEFRIIQMNDDFAIVPSRRLDRTGKIEAFTSPLNTRITLSNEERDAEHALEAICEAVSKATGQHIGLGTVTDALRGMVVRLEAQDSVARDVLFKALRDLHPGQSSRSPSTDLGMPVPLYTSRTAWSLLYDPHSKFFALNIRQVLKEAYRPLTGAVMLVPIPISAEKR